MCIRDRPRCGTWPSTCTAWPAPPTSPKPYGITPGTPSTRSHCCSPAEMPDTHRPTDFADALLIHLISIPVTNTSVNPARSTGPALFAGDTSLNQLWLLFVAPIAGALIAGFTYGVSGGFGPTANIANDPMTATRRWPTYPPPRHGRSP